MVAVIKAPFIRMQYYSINLDMESIVGSLVFHWFNFAHFLKQLARLE